MAPTTFLDTLSPAAREFRCQRDLQWVLDIVGSWGGVLDVQLASLGVRATLYERTVRVLTEVIALRGRDSDAVRRLHRLALFLRWAFKQKLHAPRVYVLQSELASSAWVAVQANRRDGNFMSFLGVPVDVFDELAALFMAPTDGVRKRGRQWRFSDSDRLALALRYLRTTGRLEDLCRDFGAAHSVIARELWSAMTRLLAVLKCMPDAQCRYPTLAEAQEMEAAVRAQYGEPPIACDQLLVLLLDGVITPVMGVSSIEDQQAYAYRGGYHAFNNAIMWTVYGTIVRYVIGAIGVSHDAWVAGPMIAEQKSKKGNPHRLALITDSGYTGVGSTGEEGGPPGCFRPISTDTIPVDEMLGAMAWSKYITTRRQAVEWGNGMLKRSFPRICVPTRLQDKEKYLTAFEAAIHVSNLRARRVGFNQLTTTFKRHVDVCFRNALVEAQRRGGADGLAMYFQLMKKDINAEIAELPIV